MVEPMSLTAGAIATLVLTKAFEKAGEGLGGKAVEQSEKLMKLIQKKAPNIASMIDLERQKSTVTPQNDLIVEIEKLAKSNSEVAQVIAEVTKQLSPNIIQQVMASDIIAKNLKAGDLTQKANSAVFVKQKIASNLKVEDTIEFGNLTQEVKDESFF